MENPGVYTLVALGLTVAQTAAAQTPVTSLDGLTAVTLEAELLGGSGGSTASLVAQTSFDGGSTWLDIARFDFTTSAAKKWAVIEGLAARAVAAYSALAAEGVNNGILGDRLRGVVTSTVTYTNTTVSLRASVR